MYFLEEAEAILVAYDEGRVEMTDTQYLALKQLYDRVDQYDSACTDSYDDETIVNDPKWHEIREYAKEVYAIYTSTE